MLFEGTPGLTTTSSIWSKSHDGTSPASSLTTPSPLSASASFGQSMNSFRSFRTTSAPRAARKRTDATPLRPAPMTSTFLPSSSITHLAKLQRRKAQQREQDRDDEEAEDDLRLLPARHLEVVVQRRHLEEPPARPQPPLRQLEEADLERYRQRLDDVDAADEDENQLLLRQHADGADGAADGEAPHVAHEDLGRRRVVPEEAEARPDHRPAEDRQLADLLLVFEPEVRGPARVAAHVGEGRQRRHRDDRHADGESVQPVRQVHRVREAEQHDGDERQVEHRPDVRDVLERRLLEERQAQVPRVVGPSLVREEEERPPHEQRDGQLPRQLPAPLQPEVLPLRDLQVVVEEPDGGEARGRDEDDPDVEA